MKVIEYTKRNFRRVDRYQHQWLCMGLLLNRVIADDSTKETLPDGSIRFSMPAGLMTKIIGRNYGVVLDRLGVSKVSTGLYHYKVGDSINLVDGNMAWVERDMKHYTRSDSEVARRDKVLKFLSNE